MLHFSYGDFYDYCDEDVVGIIQEDKCKEQKERNLMVAMRSVNLKEDVKSKEEPHITCNVECLDESVPINDMPDEVITINTAMVCYKNSYTSHGFKKCLESSQTIVDLKELKTSRIESHVQPNIGNSAIGQR